ncbi:SusD/RagB family nutrient-binding outer membrane lipoprotein [Oceanihabitans sediminis]|uniref:SusD/RagB family nutrient-binding outer membrane lipoprotein n=1 Tax=Oceanihabitans sediminis TaxID=1812012 RepID=UPI00299D0CD8|nr:SusD/RagB family nutrient-binding outer membrane lipoprotein [Oceanihabitans sediminis]MDX1278452.1 SusD/RagB family nutrient-binding outer membrane lipoprotein [Oceanihabitans sediminis]
MKKIFLSILTLTLIFSCMSDEKYDRFNEDPKNPTQVSEDVLFTAATKSLVDQMSSINVNMNVFRMFAQYCTQVTYIDESNYDLNGRGITDNHWSEMYRDVLLDLQDSKTKVNENANLTAAEKAGRIAQIEVLSVYAWQQLVDTFGDIPYTEALNIIDYPLPAYDDAATVIYPDLINRLDAVIPSFDTGEGFNAVADRIYNGDMGAWKKFANSLKLRVGMRLSDVNPGLAQSTVESAAPGVFTSNDDNALLYYQSATPNTNPVWVDLVESGRKDYVATETIIDIMNDLDDPRREFYFRQNVGPDTYQGGVYGDSNSYTANTQLGDILHEATTPGVLMDFAEVSFLLATAATPEYNFSVGGTTDFFYSRGIEASIEYWGGLPADALAYLADPDVAYATAPGTWREKIGKQFWLAMYNRGFEGWTVWRKYDAPVMNIAAESGLPVPHRYTYPIDEQNLNVANYDAASASIGGDAQGTKLFWDVN